MSTLGTGKEDVRVASRCGCSRQQAYLDALVRKEMHTSASMNSSAPVSPQERSISNHEWMQEDAHLAWLRGVVAIPLALVAQRTRAATANTGCVHHAQTSVRFSTMFMGSQGGVMGMVRGQVTGQGLFTTTLRGHGSAAVMAHGGVIELPVTPQRPVHVDPQAYVAHRGEIRNKLSAALGWREFVGRGSGEAFQLELSGQGTVYVQASEEKL